MIRHGATVEQVTDGDGDEGYRAVCLETGAICDAYAFVNFMTWNDHGAAIARALKYLGDPALHSPGSRGGCRFAEHVMEHDRSPSEATTARKTRRP